MAGNQTLTVGGDTVTLSPRYGYEETNMGRITHRDTLGGVTYTRIWFWKDSFQVPVNNISNADKVFLEKWRREGTDITYKPDADVEPGTSIPVRITDKISPLRMMDTGDFNTAAVYEGLLSLRKTTAS